MAQKPIETSLDILSPADRTKLEALGDEIEKSKKILTVLKQLGVGVNELEAQLNWAAKRRDILLGTE